MTGEDIDSKPAIYPWGHPMEEESVKVDFFSSIPVGQSSKKGNTGLGLSLSMMRGFFKVTLPPFNHFGSLFVGEEHLDTYDLFILNIFISFIPSGNEER